MPPLNSFESVFARALEKKIKAVQEANAEDLAKGNAVIQNDLVATGGNYLSSVAYIRALDNVLDWCRDVEDEMMGRTGKK